MSPAEIQELEGLVAVVLPELEDDAFKAILLSARGRQHLVRGDLRAAEVDLRDAVALDPGFSVARFIRTAKAVAHNGRFCFQAVLHAGAEGLRESVRDSVAVAASACATL